MDESTIREALADIYEEDAINEIIKRVDAVNEVAKTRIARSKNTDVVEETEEIVEEEIEEIETEETEEIVEEEIEEIVEEEIEEEIEENIDIELGETFVADLVGSQEFQDALNQIVSQELRSLRTQLRSLEENLAAQEEYVADVPVRTRRKATVSYRPRSVAVNETDDGQDDRTFQEVADETINEIFG